MVLPYASLEAEPGQAKGAIRQALAAVRKHLGMEIAYVSEFAGGLSVFREVDAPGLEALIKPGDSRSLDDVYCPHILAGRLPELMPTPRIFRWPGRCRSPARCRSAPMRACRCACRTGAPTACSAASARMPTTR